MSKEKQIEKMAFTDVDILANDMNQHCADLADDYCGGVNCLTCLAHALTAKGYRKASDVAREIFEEIEYLIWQYDTRPASDLTEEIAELKKKYAEGGK